MEIVAKPLRHRKTPTPDLDRLRRLARRPVDAGQAKVLLRATSPRSLPEAEPGATDPVEDPDSDVAGENDIYDSLPPAVVADQREEEEAPAPESSSPESDASDTATDPPPTTLPPPTPEPPPAGDDDLDPVAPAGPRRAGRAAVGDWVTIETTGGYFRWSKTL